MGVGVFLYFILCLFAEKVDGIQLAQKYMFWNEWIKISTIILLPRITLIFHCGLFWSFLKENNVINETKIPFKNHSLF